MSLALLKVKPKFRLQIDMFVKQMNKNKLFPKSGSSCLETIWFI